MRPANFWTAMVYPRESSRSASVLCLSCRVWRGSSRSAGGTASRSSPCAKRTSTTVPILRAVINQLSEHQLMRITVGVMGSAAPDSAPLDTGRLVVEQAERLARSIAGREVVLFTRATTGLVYVVGKTAREAGCFHVGISPGANEREHEELYHLPNDACDVIVYTGFGLKSRYDGLERL